MLRAHANAADIAAAARVAAGWRVRTIASLQGVATTTSFPAKRRMKWTWLRERGEEAKPQRCMEEAEDELAADAEKRENERDEEVVGVPAGSEERKEKERGGQQVGVECEEKTQQEEEREEDDDEVLPGTRWERSGVATWGIGECRRQRRAPEEATASTELE